MNNIMSSGGLAYVYFNGYEENGLLHIETVDSYRYLADAFYEQVMERSAAERAIEAVHVFAVLGIKERAQAIYHLVEGELKENFQRILNGTDIVKFSDELDKTGNAFFTCVQEFFVSSRGISRGRVSASPGTGCLRAYAAAVCRMKRLTCLRMRLFLFGLHVRSRVCAGNR